MRLSALVATTGLALALAAACSSTDSHLLPTGGEPASPLKEAHFLRRLHLDLTGLPPTDAELADDQKRLDDHGNTADTRLALADDLIARPAFATTFVVELENKALGGMMLEESWQYTCLVLADTDPGCAACGLDDPCKCKCPAVEQTNAEHDAILAAQRALKTGKGTTSALERAYADTEIYQLAVSGTPEGIATAIWDGFLDRKIDPDELENGKRMVSGALVAGTSAGLLYHRIGGSYDDLCDIVFTSEVYREAIVARVFDRYLGRPPSAAERAAFVAALDDKSPDARPVIRAVVASNEYFGG